MNRVEDLKAELSKWPDSATRRLCLDIIDVLVRLSDEDLRMLTFTSFKNVTNRKYIDDVLIGAVGLLANTTIHALDTKLLFIDDNEHEFEIDKEEFAQAQKIREFIHPETGRPVEDFETKIIPFFVPSEKLRVIRAG